MFTIKKLSWLLMIPFVVLIACSSPSSEEAKTEETQTETESEETGSSTVSLDQPRTEAIVVKGAESGKEIVKVQVIDKETVEVSFGEMALTGKNKNAEKRPYKDKSGYAILEVKSKEPSKVKLNTNDGRLLWKLKISGDKVKISNNEEGENPFELKKNDEGKIKVKYQDNELGSVKLNDEGTKVKVKKGETDRFEIETNKNSYAFALLLIDEIPAEEKYILMAELLARGM